MVQSSYQLELRRRQADATARRNTSERDAVSRTVGALGGVVASPENPVTEPKERDNALTLLAGTHGGAELKKPNTQLSAAPGTLVDRQWLIDTTDQVTTLTGIHFRCLDAKADNAAALVTIAAGSTVVFTGCIFELDGVTMAAMVTVESTAKASFIGCSFIGVQTAGNPVVNAGFVTDVYVIGCSNKTGQAHSNVTIIAESD